MKKYKMKVRVLEAAQRQPRDQHSRKPSLPLSQG